MAKLLIVFSELSNDQLKGENGFQIFVDVFYQRDVFSVISGAYGGFHRLLKTRHKNSESLKFFEIRFSADVAKFNSISTTTKLPQCITPLMFLRNAAIEHLQLVSFLNAAAPIGIVFRDQPLNDDFLKLVTYKQLASVVKQWEKAPIMPLSLNDALADSYACACPEKSYSGRGKNMHRPSNAALKKHPCHVCSEYGHWKDIHDSDGSLKEGKKSIDTAEEFSTAASGSSSGYGGENCSVKKKLVFFNNAVLTSLHCGNYTMDKN